MQKYHKIQTVYKRDPATSHKTLLDGQYSLPEFEYLAENEWVFTEKVDGTNIRIGRDGDGLAVGGRTDRAQIATFLLDAIRSLVDPNLIADGMVLYGEGYGPKIQKGGGNYRPDPSFVLFDVRVGDWWLQRIDVEAVASDLGLETVPIIGVGTLHEMIALTREGFASTWGDFRAEGVVARPTTELNTRGGERVITKIKCKDFPT